MIEGGLLRLKNPLFSREINDFHIFEQFHRSSTQDLAGFSFALVLLPVAPCARTPNWLPAPAHALLFSPSLPIALCATKNIRKACGGGSLTSALSSLHAICLNFVLDFNLSSSRDFTFDIRILLVLVDKFSVWEI